MLKAVNVKVLKYFTSILLYCKTQKNSEKSYFCISKIRFCKSVQLFSSQPVITKNSLFGGFIKVLTEDIRYLNIKATDGNLENKSTCSA